MPRLSRPVLGVTLPETPEPQVLKNGAFGHILLSGKTMTVTNDMITLGERIGKGGYAEVYRKTINGIVLARKDVKVNLNIDDFDDIDNVFEKRLREVDVIKGCSLCPFIVHFYGYYVHREVGMNYVSIHIFMEELAVSARYLKDETIKRNGKTIPEFVIGRIACSVIHALWYLKEKMQIIHRDVKPSNILVDNDGRVKICDFGISGVLQNSIAISWVGCQQYTAPEINETTFNKNGYSVKSDIWSLGITIYELATLQLPYPPSNGLSLLSAIKTSKPPRLPEGQGFSDNLQNFVESLLQIDKELRPHFNGVQNLAFFKEHDVPFSCIGTGVGVPNGSRNAERESVGAWLDNFRFFTVAEEPDSKLFSVPSI